MPEENNIQEVTNKSRVEQLLAAWAGGDQIELWAPQSNIERILMNILGADGVDINPIQSRNEALLLQILENGGGSGGGGGGESNPVYIEQQTLTGETNPYIPAGSYYAEGTVEEGVTPGGQTLIVTVDSTDYEVEADQYLNYGAPFDDQTETLDFSTYPFQLYVGEGASDWYFPDDDPHTVKAVAILMVPEGEEEITENGYYNVADKAFSSVNVQAEAQLQGSITVVNNYGEEITVCVDKISPSVPSSIVRWTEAIPSGTSKVIPVPYQMSETFPKFNNVVAVFRSVGSITQSTPQVSTGGEVVAGQDCYYVSVKNGGTITIPAP